MAEGVYRFETDILYAASNRLTQASNPEELLEAISLYARECGAVSALLFYVLTDAQGTPVELEAMAQWSLGSGIIADVGTIARIDELGMQALYDTNQARPIFVENAADADRLPVQARARYRLAGIGSSIMLLLANKNRWIGGVSINWTEPRTFDERDQRIYNALSQLAAPIIDSIQLLEQTRRRAAELEAANNEIDLLHTAATQLNLAVTPADQLEAVSAYARSQGATQGILFYVDRDSGENPPQWLAVVAEWVTDPRQEAGIGARFQTLSLPFTQGVLANTSQVVLFEDLENHPIVDPVMAEILRVHIQRGAAILPITVKGGLIGILWFTWNQPHRFDQRDQRYYAALIQQTTPILESTYLLEQTRWRAAELEAINHEIDSLYQASSRLARARTPDELLEAVSDYPRRMGANAGSLTYAMDQEGPGSGWREIVAEWIRPGALAHGVGMRFENAAYSGITHWLRDHDQPWLVTDVAVQNEMDTISRQVAAEHHIVSEAILPLRNQGRLVGVLLFGWSTRYTFTERDQRIYTALIQLAAPVIDSVRLLEDNRARAQRAEDAYREADTLYRASKAINAASTFEALVRAVEDFDVGAHGIALSIWENYDFDRASYFEVMATGRLEDPRRVGSRLGPEHFPITRMMSRDYPTFVEDIEDDAIDPISRESWRIRGVRAGIAVPLTLNNRWMGTLAFHSHLPRRYTELEKRLVAGIGALVAAAIERIRLQRTTELSRRRAESLAQISSALSQATDEQAILTAIEPLAQELNVALSVLAFANANEHGQVVEVLTVALRSPFSGPIAIEDFPVSAFGLEDFPFLRTAYEQPDAPVFIDNTHTQSPDAAASAEWPGVIVIPLKAGDKWHGVLMFLWAEPQIFDAETRRIVTALQAPVASIVATRRAYVAERQRARELETVAQVSAAVVSVLDVDELLNAISEVTRYSFTDYRCFIYLLDDASQQLVQATFDGYVPVAARSIRLDDSRSLIAQAGRARRGVIVNDTRSSPNLDTAPLLPRARSEMAVPMAIGNRLIGVLDIQSPQMNRFSEADIWVMGALADLVAVAVQNARLYAKAQEAAALEERNRLARELHDSVSQALYGIALGARTARTLLERDPTRLKEPLDYVLSLAEAGLTEMRALIFELRPESLATEGLAAALTKQAAAIQARHSIEVTTDLGTEPEIPLEMKETLYRIAREALHNTVKHAHATQITLTLHDQPDGLVLHIQDNGVGFDAAGSFPGHLGLKSMRERAARFSGTCTIASTPQQGTHIQVQLPRPN